VAFAVSPSIYLGALDKAAEILEDANGDPAGEPVENAFPVMPGVLLRPDYRCNTVAASSQEDDCDRPRNTGV
jgi:hypothetical protein